jgi:hypothetical protein
MDKNLVCALNNSFQGRGWQGPTLLGSIRGVTAKEAGVTPVPLKHSIWQVVLHAAYWKYAVCLRIAKSGVVVRGVPCDDAGELTFPRSPSNFPDLPEKPTDASWRDDVRLLKDFHEGLVDAVGCLSTRQLDSIPPGGKSRTLRLVILGAAAHDAYHSGQIQLIKRLVRARRDS